MGQWLVRRTLDYSIVVEADSEEQAIDAAPEDLDEYDCSDESWEAEEQDDA